MSESAQGTRHVSTIMQETMGKDIVALIVGELRQQPNHWLRMAQEEQVQALERIRSRTSELVIRAASVIMSTNFPMVRAELDGITIKDGVKISLSMAANDPNRHSLFDAKGTQCLVVMGDAQQWLERMDEVKAMADQQDLFNADYDPKQDQPGYRRDQSPTKPAGKSWAEIKAGFDQGLLTKSEAEQEFGGALPDTDPNPDPLDIKGKDRSVNLVGIVEYRSLQTDEPESWGEWIAIPTDQLPAIDEEETLREALVSIHLPVTSEFRLASRQFSVEDVCRSFGVTPAMIGHRHIEPNPVPQISPQDQAEIERKSAMVGLHEELTEIGMPISLGAVQALSPEQRTLAGDWLMEYVQWAHTPKRKKKDLPKRPHFLPLFEPLPPNQTPPADGEQPT